MIAPSILSADFARLADEAAAEAGVDCFVAGSAVYGAEDPAAALEKLRAQAARAASGREWPSRDQTVRPHSRTHEGVG
jgi:pentose-5-phosphate-3-epimerase